MSVSLDNLQKALGYQFRDPALMELALSHRSRGGVNNERLEFLGDAVLNCNIAEALFERFPDASEGDLSRMRAALVCGEALAELARELNLGDVLRLGQADRKSGVRRRDSVLADALEALLGAICRDGGREVVRERILDLFAQKLDTVSPQAITKDPKSRLQEWLQGRGDPLPDYQLAAVEGEGHQQVFTVHCAIAGQASPFVGVGSSRQRAEQAAAESALVHIGA